MGSDNTFCEKNFNSEIEIKPKYLVRPRDFHIFDIDESNGCYRSYINMDALRGDGSRPNAQNISLTKY